VLPGFTAIGYTCRLRTQRITSLERFLERDDRSRSVEKTAHMMSQVLCVEETRHCAHSESSVAMQACALSELSSADQI
jgi:hypothetical protein